MSLIYFVTTLWNNPYIPSILSQFTNEIIASPSTNHHIKILNVLKKRKKNNFSIIRKQKKKNEKNSSKRNNRRERVEVVDDKSFLIIKLAVFFLPLNVTESLNTLIFLDSILNFKSGELFDRYSKWREPTRRRQRYSRWGKEEKRLEHYKWSRPPSQ